MSPCSDKELQQLDEGLKPAKTGASTQWGIKIIMKWAQNQKMAVSDGPVPDDILECHDPATVSKYLYMFAAEREKKTVINIPSYY